MAKHNDYTLHDDGSVTFVGDVSDAVRAKAYEEAAALVASRQRAAGSEVDDDQADQIKALASESADITAERAHATDVDEEAKKK